MPPPASVFRIFFGRPDKGGEFIGSAFFVAPDTALTARHVVRDADPARLFLQVGWSGVAAIGIKEVVPHSDAQTDVAILRIGRRSRLPSPSSCGWPRCRSSHMATASSSTAISTPTAPSRCGPRR